MPGPAATPWPNQEPVVDGVIPRDEIPQDPHLFDGLPDDNEEMD